MLSQSYLFLKWPNLNTNWQYKINCIRIISTKNGSSSLSCKMCTNDQMASHCCFDCSVFICEDCVKLHLWLNIGITILHRNKMSSNRKNKKILVYHMLQNIIQLLDMRMSRLKSTVPINCAWKMCVFYVPLALTKIIIYVTSQRLEKKWKLKWKLYLKSIELKDDKADRSIAQLSVINEKCLKNSQQLQAEIKARFLEAKKTLEKREKDLFETVALHLQEKRMCLEIEKKKYRSIAVPAKKQYIMEKFHPK